MMLTYNRPLYLAKQYFSDGVFAMPRPSNKPRLKVRALHDYCKKKESLLQN